MTKHTTKPRRKIIRHNTAANQEKHRADWLPLEPNELGVVADRVQVAVPEPAVAEVAPARRTVVARHVG